jgi:hypothetical protein
MQIWWIIPALAGLLALTMVAGGLAALLHGRPYRALSGITGGGALLVIALAVLLLGFDFQTYHRLAYERPVAAVDLHQTGDKAFAVTVTQPEPSGQIASQPSSYAVQGDEWRVEARVLKWKSWANVLGLDPRYRLDRLSGEYVDTAEEVSAPRSVYDLRAPVDQFTVARLAAKLNRAKLIDTVYGSAVLMPMADGARYELSMSQSGLVARPANDAAQKAVEAWR